MNEQELREFLAARGPSPHVARRGAEGLACYGCAHSSAFAPPPGQPSGERPCQSCVRNPEVGMAPPLAPEYSDTADPAAVPVAVDDAGHAHVFNPWVGAMYNGAPRLYHPMDNYVTLDQRDQEEWLRAHPEYERAVRWDGHSQLRVIDDGATPGKA